MLVPLVVQACGDAQPPAPHAAESPSTRLERDTGVPWIVDVDPTSGAADLLVALRPIASSAPDGAGHERAARAFLAKYRDLFRLRDPDMQLSLEEVVVAGDGAGHVRF